MLSFDILIGAQTNKMHSNFVIFAEYFFGVSFLVLLFVLFLLLKMTVLWIEFRQITPAMMNKKEWQYIYNISHLFVFSRGKKIAATHLIFFFISLSFSFEKKEWKNTKTHELHQHKTKSKWIQRESERKRIW